MDVKQLLSDLAERQMPSAPPLRPGTVQRAHRRRAMVAAATSLAVVAGALGVWAGIGSLSRPRPVPPAERDASFSMIALDGTEATALAAHGDAAWAATDGKLYRITGSEPERIGPFPDTYLGQPFEQRMQIDDLAANENGVWVAASPVGARCGESDAVAKDPCGDARWIPAGGAPQPARFFAGSRGGIAIGNGSTWVGGTTVMYKVTTDQRDAPVVAPRKGVRSIVGIASTLGQVFALVEPDDGRVDRALLSIEPNEGGGLGRLDLPGALIVRAGLGSLWVAAWHEGAAMLYQIHPERFSILRTIRLIESPGDAAKVLIKGLAFSGSTVYAAAARGDQGIVLAFDARTGTVETLRAAGVPVDIAAGHEALWVLHSRPARLARMTIPDPWDAHAPINDDERAEAVPERPGLEHPRITRIDRLEPSGDRLTIGFLGGDYPCGMLDHVELWEDRGRLMVLVVEGVRPTVRDGQWGCKSVGIGRTTTVEIPERLRGLEPADAAQD